MDHATDDWNESTQVGTAVGDTGDHIDIRADKTLGEVKDMGEYRQVDEAWVKVKDLMQKRGKDRLMWSELGR